jgi:hypothetical protein
MFKLKASYSSAILLMVIIHFLKSTALFADDIASYNVYLDLISTFKFASPQDVQIYDNSAYVLSQGLLTKADISDPALPKDFITYTGMVDIEQMALLGKYVYVSSGTRIYYYDIGANPPTEKGFFEANGAIIRISISEGYLVFIRKDLGIFVYDLKYPDNPIFKGTQIVPGEPSGLYLVNSKAYVTCSNAYMSIIDFNDPVKLPIVGTYTFGVNFYDIYVKDNVAYLSQGSTGVQVLNVASAGTPKWQTNIFSRRFSRQVVVSNYYAWVNDDNSIQAFFIKDPLSYLYAGSFDNKKFSMNRMAVIDGKYVYACSSDNLLKVIRISYAY